MSGFPAYYWRHKQRYVARFCTEADARSFLNVGEELENLAAIGFEPEPDVAYGDQGHLMCMADDCPDGEDDV